MRLCLVSSIIALIVSVQFQSEQWPLLLMLLAAVIFLPLSTSIVQRILSILCIFLSTLYCHVWLAERLEGRLPASLSGSIFQGYGEVISCRDTSSEVQKLLIRVDSNMGDEGLVKGIRKLSINYYRGIPNKKSNKSFKAGANGVEDVLVVARISCGSLLKFKAKLRAPYSYINPWGFDYEAFLLSTGVDATGYLLQHEVVGVGAGWRSELLMLRERWVERARSMAAPAGQLVPALLFGESSYLPKNKWNEFQLTGTIHLLIVSGLHVSFLVLMVTIVWYLLVRLEVLLLFPRSSVLFKLTPLVLLLACLLYAYMAGMGLAIQRAGLMLGVGICVVYYRHHWSLLDTWLWAMLLVLMVNPLSALFVGFWFSFTAVGALLMSYSGQVRSVRGSHSSSLKTISIKENIKLFIHPQWVVFLALMPLLWSFQQSQSLLSLLVNMLAIPLLGAVIMPLALLGFIWPESMATELLNTVLISAMGFLHQISLLPSWLIYKPAGLWLLTLFPLVILSLCLPGMPFKHLSLLLLGSVFFMPLVGNKDKLIVFDVGQGLAIYGSANKTSWLYDTGAQFRSGFSLGEVVVAKNILAFNGKQLDLLFLSHSDNDHAGGEEGLRGRIIPNKTYAGQPQSSHHANCHTQADWHKLGKGEDRWRVFNYNLEFSSDNNQSCVVQIEMAGIKILLPGDIDKRAEASLLNRYGDELKSSVLLVGHHGSKSSSSQEWLMQVEPKLAVVSSGFNNRFKHPHSDVVKRFQQLSIPLYNTADSGAIEIELSESLPIIQWRKKNPPLWRQM